VSQLHDLASLSTTLLGTLGVASGTLTIAFRFVNIVLSVAAHLDRQC
jgi:hypothetical protein